MSQFAFSDSMAAMPNPSTTNYGNMDTTKLLQRLQAAEEMIETYRLGKLQLVNDLEQGFSKVCDFMQEQYNKSPDEEVTARWFKHIIADLRTSCEKEAAENKEPLVSAPVEPMDAEESINISNFTESDANFLDNMDLGLSGTGHSFSPRGGYSSSIPTTYGNSVAAFPSTCKPAPKTMVRQSKTKPKNFTDARGRERGATGKSKTKKKRGDKVHSFFCVICNKSFAGASGLWYHNKHVHNAITQSRPRNKSSKNANKGGKGSKASSGAKKAGGAMTIGANSNAIAGY